MRDFRLSVVPLTAMAVAFGWSFLTAEPQANLTPYPLPAQEMASTWQQNAGQTLGLQPALVERAMTEREWEAHQKKMRVMRPEERDLYQQAVRSRVLRQAQG
ncbi:MAG: hypothetical protein A2Z31_04360 [candidate division NC10 bacterium RBG_16_65_8]|nr:MAG: hypothetical protein A2Z31_04360 [candidate division NC10 bacterium RBG_16_65_8]